MRITSRCRCQTKTVNISIYNSIREKSGGIYNQQNNWMMNIMYRKKLILTRYIQKKIIMDGNRLGRSFESK